VRAPECETSLRSRSSHKAAPCDEAVVVGRSGSQSVQMGATRIHEFPPHTDHVGLQSVYDGCAIFEVVGRRRPLGSTSPDSIAPVTTTALGGQ